MAGLAKTIIELEVSGDGRSSENWGPYSQQLQNVFTVTKIEGIPLIDILHDRRTGEKPVDPGPFSAVWIGAEGGRDQAGYEAAVQKYENWQIANAAASAYIFGSVGKELHEACAQRPEARVLWQYLTDRFGGETLTSVAALWVRLLSLRLGDFPGVSDYLTALDKLAAEVRRAGQPVPTSLLAGSILVGMGDRYPTTRELLLTLPEAQQTRDVFALRLLEAEKNAKITADLNALHTGARRGTPGPAPGPAQQRNNRGQPPKQYPKCGYVRKRQGKGARAVPGSQCPRRHPPGELCWSKADDEWLEAHPNKGPQDLPQRNYVDPRVRHQAASVHAGSQAGSSSSSADQQPGYSPTMSGASSVSDYFDDGSFLGYILAQPEGDREPESQEEHAMHTQAMHSGAGGVIVALDSGATTSCFKQGSDFRLLQRPVEVQGALPGLTTSVRGTVALPCPALPSGHVRGLHDPSFRHNLISLGELQRQGVEVLFPARSRQAVCRDPKTGQTLWTFQQGALGLYETRVSQPSAEATATTVQQPGGAAVPSAPLSQQPVPESKPQPEQVSHGPASAVPALPQTGKTSDSAVLAAEVPLRPKPSVSELHPKAQTQQQGHHTSRVPHRTRPSPVHSFPQPVPIAPSKNRYALLRGVTWAVPLEQHCGSVSSAKPGPDKHTGQPVPSRGHGGAPAAAAESATRHQGGGQRPCSLKGKRPPGYRPTSILKVRSPDEPATSPAPSISPRPLSASCDSRRKPQPRFRVQQGVPHMVLPLTSAQTQPNQGPPAPADHSASTHPTEQLHWRLNHMSESSVRTLIRHQAIEGLPATYVAPPRPLSTTCTPCIQGKTQAKPHPLIRARAGAILDKIHVDLVGPFPPTIRSHRYWLTIVDDHSRYGWIILLHTKDQAKHKLLAWMKWVQRQTGKPLKHFHGDRGGEFLNTVLLDYFREQGVTWTFSNPHTPQQNGVAEARNKQIGRFTRTSLLHSNAPKFYWGYAAQHACVTNNLVPHGLLGGKTPYEVWHSRKPNMHRLRTWGCVAHALIDKSQRHHTGGKLGPVTKECILVGLNPEGPGWLLLDTATRREIPCSDVVFQEHIPYFKRPSGLQSPTLDWSDFDLSFPAESPPSVPPAPGPGPGPPPTPPDSDQPGTPSARTAGTSQGEGGAQPEESSQEEGGASGPEHSQGEGGEHQEQQSSADSDQDSSSTGGVPSQHSPPQPRAPLAPAVHPSVMARSRAVTGTSRGPGQLPVGKGVILGLPASGAPAAPAPAPPPPEERRSLRLQGLPPSSGPAEELHTIYEDTEFIDTGVPPPAVVFLQAVIAGESGSKVTEIPTPSTWEEALGGEQSAEWLESMVREFRGLEATGTFKQVPRSEAASVLKNKWVFRIKRRGDGTPLYKSRIVVKGYTQQQGIDYAETWAPTAKPVTWRVLLHLAAQQDFHIRMMDVDQAFCQGDLEEDLYMEPPAGLPIAALPGNQVWKLQRPLYGLKQAPRQWHAKLKEVLEKLGFKPTAADPSLFLYKDSQGFWILAYVDDLLLLSKSTELLDRLREQLKEFFPMKDLGDVQQYLGMEVTRDWDRHEIYLAQTKYIHELLTRFDYIEGKEFNTPLAMNHGLRPAQEGDPMHPDQERYPELLGGIMYLMVCTRPDIAHAVSVLARYVAPGRHSAMHWQAGLRLLGYLKATAGYKLALGGATSVLEGHSDSSYADDQEGRRSSQGHCFSLGSGVVSWKATRSPVVALSTCEAELYAVCSAAQEAVWLGELLALVGCPQSPAPMLWCDNRSTVVLTQDPVYSARSKHIEARYYFVRELVQAKRLRTAHVPGKDNVADIFTKPLSHEDHARLTAMLGLRP
jgi:transposase InsO family protein